MHVTINCPSCQNIIRSEVLADGGTLLCEHCDWTRPVERPVADSRTPECCIACGCSDLWRQKDFPQRLGLLFVALGAIFSTIAWAYMRPVLAIAILMTFALVDFLLYTFMKDVLVCYRCHAQHRRTNIDDGHPRFDLEVAERYRQEEIRLKDATPQ